MNWRREVLVAMALVGICWSASSGERPRQGDKPMYQRLFGPGTLGFYHVDVAAVMKSKMWQGLHAAMRAEGESIDLDQVTAKEVGIPISQWENMTLYFEAPSFAGGEVRPPEITQPYFLIRTRGPVDREAVLNALGKERMEVKFDEILMHVNRERGVAVLDDRHVFFATGLGVGPNSGTGMYRSLFARVAAPQAPPAGLAKYLAMAESKKHVAVAGFVMPEGMGGFVAEQLNNAPPFIRSLEPLTALQNTGVTINLGTGEKDLQLDQSIAFANADHAKKAEASLKQLLDMGKTFMTQLDEKDPFWAQTKPQFLKWLEDIKITSEGSQVAVTIAVNSEMYTRLVVSAIQKVRTAANRMISASNMRQMMIAMHNYHADFQKLPPAVSTAPGNDGKPLHSWRVLILPYIEQDNLYKQFKLDEPWDSPHNKAVFDKNPMPKLFEHPGKKDGDSKMTYYKVFVSKPSVAGEASAGFTFGKHLTLGQLTVQDGTSNTAALIEAGPPVPWTKPEDIDFDAKAALPKMLTVWKEPRVSVAFFDGSVRSLTLGVHEDIWKAIITRNGGEAVDPSKLEEGK